MRSHRWALRGVVEDFKYVTRIICAECGEGSVWGVHFQKPISLFADVCTQVGSVWVANGCSCHLDTQQITIWNVVLDNSGRLSVAILPTHSPTSVAGHLLPNPPFFLSSRQSRTHCCPNISTHCPRIHLAFLNLAHGRQLLNYVKKSDTSGSQFSEPLWYCVKQFCPRIM